MELSSMVDEEKGLEEWASALATEIDGIKHEMSDLQRRLEAAEERLSLVNRLRELNSDSKRPAGSGSLVVHPAVQSGADHSVPSSNVELEDEVAAILSESGSPLHISEIRKRLIAKGVRIPGRGDDANIIVRIRKFDDKFTRTARGTYALAAWGLPSVDAGRGSRPKKASKR